MIFRNNKTSIGAILTEIKKLSGLPKNSMTIIPDKNGTKVVASFTTDANEKAKE